MLRPTTGNEHTAKILPDPYVRIRRRHLQFKNNRQVRRYNKLVRDVKKVLPIANEVQRAIIETYEYLMTLPDDKARQQHLKAVEKSIKEQYTPRMKKLTFSQGKLLIKLVDRQTNSTGYELVKAFLGPFRAGFYQAFAALFGASLKKDGRAEISQFLHVHSAISFIYLIYNLIPAAPHSSTATLSTLRRRCRKRPSPPQRRWGRLP